MGLSLMGYIYSNIFQGGWSINTNLYGSHVDGAVLPALQWILLLRKAAGAADKVVVV
jgi:hypothetical protein